MHDSRRRRRSSLSPAGLTVLLCLGLMLTASSGCSGDSAPSDAPGDKDSTAATPAEPGSTPPVKPPDEPAPSEDTRVITPPPDRSLTIGEYITMGLPACNRTWTADDMVRATNALIAVEHAGSGRLPRCGSANSGAVFQRITAAENLEAFADRSLAVETRLSALLKYAQGANTIAKLYLLAFVRGATGDTEMIDMVGLQLRTTAVIVRVIDEFVPTLDKSDPKYAARMQGLATVRLGAAQLAEETLQTLTETHAYRKAELVRLLRYMEETFPAIVTAMEPDARQRLLARLRNMSENPERAYLQPGLGSLVSVVQDAAGTTP